MAPAGSWCGSQQQNPNKQTMFAPWCCFNPYVFLTPSQTRAVKSEYSRELRITAVSGKMSFYLKYSRGFCFLI